MKKGVLLIVSLFLMVFMVGSVSAFSTQVFSPAEGSIYNSPVFINITTDVPAICGVDRIYIPGEIINIRHNISTILSLNHISQLESSLGSQTWQISCGMPPDIYFGYI